MPMPTMAGGPPPAGDLVAQQQPSLGPFAQAAQRGPQAPPQPGPGPNGGDPGAIQGAAEVVKTHLESMMRQEPALTPFLQHAINDIETGMRTVFANRQQNAMAQTGTLPISGAAPPTEPGAGLPM